MNSQNWYNYIIGFDTSFHSIIWLKNSHTGYLQLEESTANTPFEVLVKLVWSHHWLKMPHFGHISCLLRQETISLQTEDFRIQVRGPPDNYVYGCHMTQVTRGALGYVSSQKGIIQGLLFKESPCHVFQDRVSDCVFTICKQQECFPISHILWRISSDVFGVHVTHWLLCQTDEINTIFQSFIGYLYEDTGEF